LDEERKKFLKTIEPYFIGFSALLKRMKAQVTKCKTINGEKKLNSKKEFLSMKMNVIGSEQAKQWSKLNHKVLN
jgi:hypothetical protein